MMFLQRAVLIFVMFLCCFRSCLSMNCANFPYHPSCRGTMKRTLTELEFSDSYPQYRHMYDTRKGCSLRDCKTEIKYLFALLNQNADHQLQVDGQQNKNLYDTLRKGLRTRPFEQRSKNNLFETKDMNQDYID